MTDQIRYFLWQATKQNDWEGRCVNCGACCGAFEDPCEHLQKTPDGRFACAVYERRFGTHKTVSGKPLRCVPIREKIGTSWPGDEHCGYKKSALQL